MCVTSATAHLNNTVVGGWDIQHPTYGYRHVLAYQNAPKNLASGANCMLLHIPTTTDLVPSDLVDTSSYPELLYDIVKTLIPPPPENTRSLGVSPKNHVIEMGVYHVALLNDLSSTALKGVLNQIPVSKRPTIASALLEFYVEQFPNYRLVLACFDNKSVKTASAIMLHYEPMFPKKIFFPLLEGHDGKVPRIGQDVRMRQQIIYGSVSRIESTLISLSIPHLPKALHPFLPKYVGYQSLDNQVFPNNDTWFKLDTNHLSETSNLPYLSNWREILKNTRKALRRYFSNSMILNYFRVRNKEQVIGTDDYESLLQNEKNQYNLSYDDSSDRIIESLSSQEETMLLEEMNLETSIEHTLLDKSIIRELISNGNTEKVLLKLQNAGYPKATISYEKYKEKAKLMQMGTLDTSEWYTLQKQLYKDILTWEYAEETRAQILLTQAQKLHIRQLIKNNQTADALNFCKDLDDKPAILSGYYERIMKGRVLNMLTESEEHAYLTEINEAIEELVA